MDPSERPIAERLFDTAAELFGNKGFAATTTREIATAVGIQQASLYYHVASKEDLVYKICHSLLERFLVDVPARVSGVADPFARVRVMILTHVATLMLRQRRSVTALTELRSLSPRHRAEVTALRDRYEHFVRSTIQDAQEAGKLRRDIPPKYLCLPLLGALNHSALWFRKGQGLTEDQLGDIIAKVFLEGAATKAARATLRSPDLEPENPSPGTRNRRKPGTARTDGNPALNRALDAAVELFSRKGYTATSTREVAALLGIQKASLYYHIDSKEDLLYAACRSALEQIRQDVATALEGITDPLERQRTLISSHIESLLRDQHRHATAFSEMHALSQDRLAQVLKLRHDYQSLFRSALQEGQAAGVLRADIGAKYLSLTLLGMMNRANRWFRRNGPLAPHQVGQLIAAVFLSGAGVAGK